MRPLRILFRSISSAFKSVFRNLSLSIASLTCIIITLMIVSIAIIFSSNVNYSTKKIEKDLEMVVFVKSETTEEKVKEIESNLQVLPNVEQISYVDKETAKEEMKKENDTYKKIIEGWEEGENPLDSYFIVKVKNIEDMSETAATIKNLEGVDTVNYVEDLVEKMVSTFQIIRNVLIVTVVALIFVTAFLISNTIKITIYSRRNEIDIMRLVGTSNTVIKLPFIFEGLFLGAFGSILPILVTIYSYVFLYDKLGGVLFHPLLPMMQPYNFVFKVGLILLAIGSVVGMFGSYKAVRKYLKI